MPVPEALRAGDRGHALGQRPDPPLRLWSDGRRVRLIGFILVEAWLVGWGHGHELELHDHGDSAGAIAVISGRLTEHSVDPAGSGLRRRTLRPGGTFVFDLGHAHHVANEHEEPALSVHVYSPRLLGGFQAWSAAGLPVTAHGAD